MWLIDYSPLPVLVRISQGFSGINVCGFCLSVYESTVLCSQDHSGASLVSAIRNPEGPSVGGCFNIKPMYFSIHAKVRVLYREVGKVCYGKLHCILKLQFQDCSQCMRGMEVSRHRKQLYGNHM